MQLLSNICKSLSTYSWRIWHTYKKGLENGWRKHGFMVEKNEGYPLKLPPSPKKSGLLQLVKMQKEEKNPQNRVRKKEKVHLLSRAPVWVCGRVRPPLHLGHSCSPPRAHCPTSSLPLLPSSVGTAGLAATARKQPGEPTTHFISVYLPPVCF